MVFHSSSSSSFKVVVGGCGLFLSGFLSPSRGGLKENLWSQGVNQDADNIETPESEREEITKLKKQTVAVVAKVSGTVSL